MEAGSKVVDQPVRGTWVQGPGRLRALDLREWMRMEGVMGLDRLLTFTLPPFMRGQVLWLTTSRDKGRAYGHEQMLIRGCLAQAQVTHAQAGHTPRSLARAGGAERGRGRPRDLPLPHQPRVLLRRQLRDARAGGAGSWA